MTLDEVYDIMNGREYLNELTDEEADEMKLFDRGWHFETDIPHIEYSINEDGKLFCKGIAFFLWECGA